MRLRAEWLVLVAAALLLIGSALYQGGQQRDAENQFNTGSTYSAGEGGAKALYLWLGSLGYRTERLQRPTFSLRPDDGVLWIVTPRPFLDLTDDEAEELARWLRAGGTLVWIGRSANPRLFSALDPALRDGFSELALAAPLHPWLGARSGLFESSGFHFQRFPPQATPLLADEAGRVRALHLPVGQGEAWLFATAEPFTNAGLFDKENSGLVAGLIARLPAGRPMTFDEIHHGFGGQGEVASLSQRMRREPWGWGLYYAVTMGALWLLLRGRRFGRPLPLPGEHLRREAGEFVQSMAWLYRRAQQRDPILRHHRERLKRRVARRYRLPIPEKDADFVAALARLRPDVDSAALLAHLHALQQRPPSESHLVALARANDDWLAQLES